MTFSTRPASFNDAREMAQCADVDLPVSELAKWLRTPEPLAVWTICEDSSGIVQGFQRISPDVSLQDDACEITTFLKPNAPLLVSSLLFHDSAEAARRLAYRWIRARISDANQSALTYYQSRGFRLYFRQNERIFLRFDLD